MAAERKTAEQMYEELGSPVSLSPARCAARVREIIKSQDLLSVNEQKALLLLDFIRLRDILFDRVEGTESRMTKSGDIVEVDSAPAWANALVRLLKEWRGTIDSMKADIDSEELLIRRAHAEIMVQAMRLSFERLMLELEKAGFEIPRDLAEQIIEESIPIGFQSLEKRISA